MKIKHTFLFAFVLGLGWVSYLFAHRESTRPASNGLLPGVDCSQSGCHTGNPVNAPGGALAIGGLPAEWTPGQTYTITVSVQRSAAVKYGFQLSSVVNSDNNPAGTFSNAPGENRVEFACGTNFQPVGCLQSGAIQYAQHNFNATANPPFSGSFNVNWTAPTSNIGPIRFNLAAVAADGNNFATSDFVYTRSDVISAVAAPNISRPYSLTNLQGTAPSTDGTGGLTIGYARIQPNAGSTTPAGVAIFSLRQNGVLVSEAGVPASPLFSAGRIYVEVSGVQNTGGAVNTGVAFANPNNQPASVNFFFTDSAGIETAVTTLPIPPNGQLAKFLDESPFSSGANIRGTFTFSSDVPIGVIALRGYNSERPGGSEFLITTLPVIDTLTPSPSAPVVIPHFADGGGWTTQVVLVNPTDTVLGGSVQFFNQGTDTTPGSPVSMTLNTGQTSSNFDYIIQPRSLFRLATAGQSVVTNGGSVRVNPAGGSASPSAMSIFTFKSSGITVSEAGVSGVQGNAFRMYAETSLTAITPNTVQTGVAIANSGSIQAPVTFELYKLDGTPAGVGPVTIVLGPNGQNARFLHELFPALSLPFKGILRISTMAAAGISVVGLRGRYNERPGNFLITTTPASNEGEPTTITERVFPHLVNGGGYRTQFILFSGTAGQTSDGSMRFFDQIGTPFSLLVN